MRLQNISGRARHYVAVSKVKDRNGKLIRHSLHLRAGQVSEDLDETAGKLLLKQTGTMKVKNKATGKVDMVEVLKDVTPAKPKTRKKKEKTAAPVDPLK